MGRFWIVLSMLAAALSGTLALVTEDGPVAASTSAHRALAVADAADVVVPARAGEAVTADRAASRRSGDRRGEKFAASRGYQIETSATARIEAAALQPRDQALPSPTPVNVTEQPHEDVSSDAAATLAPVRVVVPVAASVRASGAKVPVPKRGMTRLAARADTADAAVRTDFGVAMGAGYAIASTGAYEPSSRGKRQKVRAPSANSRAAYGFAMIRDDDVTRTKRKVARRVVQHETLWHRTQRDGS